VGGTGGIYPPSSGRFTSTSRSRPAAQLRLTAALPRLPFFVLRLAFRWSVLSSWLLEATHQGSAGPDTPRRLEDLEPSCVTASVSCEACWGLPDIQFGGVELAQCVGRSAETI
jgi:hypothetical protein